MTVVPPHEADRLRALQRYAMLDTAPEPAFDRAVRMTARVLRAPLAAISLVDAERIWFKARTGFTTAEIPRAGALCAHTVQLGRTYVVADTLELGMPAAPPGVRFYCGAPLTTPDGFCIGTLCAMDIVPRPDFGGEALAALADLAATVMAELERRKDQLLLEAASRRLALINEVLLLTGSADGFVTAVEAVMRLLCRELDAMIGMLWTRSADGQFIRLAGLGTGEGLPPECSEIVRSAFPFPVGQSLLARLLQTGGRLAVPQVTGELAAQYPLLHFGRLHGMHSLTAESLVVGDQRCLLVFCFATQRQDLDQAADLLRDVGQAIRPALQRKQAQDQLALMNDVLARCGGAGSFAVAVESTLALLNERTDALFGMMCTRSSDDTNIRLGAIALSAGVPPAFRQLAMAQFPYPAGKLLLARLLDGEGRMVVPQLTEDMTRKYPLTRFGYEHGVRSFAAQSIAVGDTRYLLLLAYATERHDLNSVVDLTREIGQAIRPVLQRKQAQDRLSLLQAAVDAASDAVAITDAAGDRSGDYRLIYTNPAFARMSGFGPDEVQGRGVGFLRGPGTDPAAVRALDESAAAGAPARIELLNYRRDGTPFWADLSNTPITGDHGEVSHWIGVTRDVTQRRADQEALQHLTAALQERTRELTDVARLARVGSWRWIGAERRFEFSDELYDIFGVPPGSVAPTLEGFYGLLHPEDRAAAYAASERAFALGQNLLCEARIQLPEGKLRTIIWNARPIRDGAGKVVELRGYGQDITEQRDTEAALRHGEKLRTLGQLTGGIAHEFNNLLTVILANLDLAADSAALTQELRSELESARRAAIGATDLTRRLLSFARAEPLRIELTDLNTWLVPLRDMTRPILGTRYTVTLRTDPGLPPCPVDRSQLESAVLNLILNARDAMPQGGIIRIETERMNVPPGARGALADVRPGHYAVVALRDNGAGMAPSVANRAFEPFFTTKASGSGSGLGLSMVLSFARNSGGTATIESRTGKGTVVHILLPLEPQPPAEVSPAEA